MKLLGITKSKITKNKNGENVPFLEINEVVLVINKIQYTVVLYTVVPNESFGHLLDISQNYFVFLKTFNSKFWYIEV